MNPGAFLIFVAAAALPPSADAPAETLRYVARLGETPVGTLVSVTHPTEDGKSRRWERTVLTLAREGQPIRLEEEAVAVEDPAGRLVRFEVVRTGLGPDRWVDSFERIERGWRRVRDRGGTPLTDTLPPEDLIGPVGIDRLLAETSESVRWRGLDPTEMVPQQVEATLLREEAAAGEAPGEVLRVFQIVDSSGSGEVVQWRDREGLLRREEERQLGWILERAEPSRSETGPLLDAMEWGRLDLEGSPPNEPPCSILLLPIDGKSRADDAPPPVPPDRDQSVESGPLPGSWRVTIDPVRPEPPTGDERTWRSDPTLEEFLRAGLIVDAEAAEIVRFAEEATRGASGPLEEAIRLERAVHRSIRVVDLKTVFATASQTLRDRVGDCTEHAVLLAACCRARGIPARLVAGIVPVGNRMVFHLWTEAYVSDWIGLDATLGEQRRAPCAIALVRWEQPEEGIAELTRSIQQLLGRYRFRFVGGE